MTVLLPMTKLPARPRLTPVPARVMAAPPAEIVVSSTLKPEGFAVKVWPATVKIEGLGRTMVLVPMIKCPEGPRLTGVPEIVSSGPPAERMVEAMENAEGLAVMVSPAMVKIADGGVAMALFGPTSPLIL